MIEDFQSWKRRSPSYPVFAATLLVLRELMHHWPVSSLQVLAYEAADALLE